MLQNTIRSNNTSVISRLIKLTKDDKLKWCDKDDRIWI